MNDTIKTLTDTFPEFISSQKPIPWFITVCSGKGGVGKSVLAANLGYMLSKNGFKALVWDADKYFPNQHLLIGVEPPVRLNDVYAGKVGVDKAIFNINDNFKLLADQPGAARFEKQDQNEIIDTYKQIITETDFDFVIIDTPAGLAYETLQCCNFSDLTLLVINDEPTSLLDAYGLIKILLQNIEIDNINLLVNNVIDFEDAEDISTKLNLATKKFLGIKFEVVGFVPYERRVRQSILNQELIAASSPDAEVSQALEEIAQNIIRKAHFCEYY